MHCRPLATIKPLNATQDRIQSHTKKGKEPDVYCFPSSPRESGTKQTSSSKGEREKETKATKKTKKVLKVRLILWDRSVLQEEGGWPTFLTTFIRKS